MNTTSNDPARGLTVADVAMRLRVSTERIHLWIRDGKLRAFNRRDGGKRPAYVVLPADLATFLNARAVAPSAPPKTTQKRKKTGATIDFYPN
jgi:hypothetical protein